jgi:hypothetical protein
MKKTAEESAFLKENKLLLGQAIKAIRTDDERGYVSLRKMEDAVGIPASNIKYIEDGVNAPSPEVYEAIVRELNPTDVEQKELDRLYSLIRGTPPPDVCKIICANQGLNNSLRVLSNQTLSKEQIAEVTALFTSFKINTTEGATING